MTLRSSPLAKTSAKLIGRLTHPIMPTDENAPEPEYDVWRAALQAWEGSWFFHGPYGVGKTGLAVGYAREWVREESASQGRDQQSLLFRSLPKLLSEIRATYNKGGSDTTEEKLLARYQRVGLFVLDDIGSEQVTNSGWMEDRLYQIIGDRHDEERPMVFTSNLTLEQLAKRIGERLTWRILEMCGPNHVISVAGPNLRDTKGV